MSIMKDFVLSNKTKYETIPISSSFSSLCILQLSKPKGGEFFELVDVVDFFESITTFNDINEFMLKGEKILNNLPKYRKNDKLVIDKIYTYDASLYTNYDCRINTLLVAHVITKSHSDISITTLDNIDIFLYSDVLLQLNTEVLRAMQDIGLIISASENTIASTQPLDDWFSMLDYK